MIIYTPIPPEGLFGMTDSTASYTELEVNGARLVVEQTGMNQCRVVRLISTDPNDYLKAEYQPGAELSFAPHVE